MRLAKLAVASVDATVGAVRSNVDRLVEMALAPGKEHVTKHAHWVPDTY